jgi:glycosyltransferase involved in cell wall biosynthesis/SAM-dependent methyltransferase
MDRRGHGRDRSNGSPPRAASYDSSRVDACTIIAKNYVAHARVLAESYARHHPDSTFHVLVIDDADGYIDPAHEPFELVTPAQLDIPDFARMAAIYDVLELSTAVKPWLLRWMLARSGAEGVLYLDPDMQVYAPLTHVFDAVRSHGLVLSPHNLEPMPRDGKRPNEQDILIAGAYNLGFIGIGSGAFADKLLDWWGERLERDCIVDPSRGFFVDQRWIDFVPGMADSFKLLRDPGFNVAYWNLASRKASRRDGRWWVNGDAPLNLFHFSGFDATRPHLLSKHQDRIQLSEEPDLARLCAEYADALLAHGVREVAEWPYTYARTHSGVPLDIVVRRLYRDLLLEGQAPDLFTEEGDAEFLEAVNAPADVGGANGVSRYLAALHTHRPDLQRAYPDLDGPDADGYLGWAHVFGRVEIPIHDALLRVRRPAHIEQDAAIAPEGGPPPPLGVNVAGYLQSVLGVGEVARQAIDALETQGIPALPVGLPAPMSESRETFLAPPPGAEGFPINLVCVNADMVGQFAADVGSDFFRDRHTAGWWWWETATFPERWHGAFDHVDEVWAGSHFVADTFAAIAPVPVVRVPTPVRRPEVPPASREALGLPAGFLFLFSFDFHSVAERKNPFGLVEAFRRAFGSAEEGPSLVIKSINGEHHRAEQERLRVAAAGHPRIQLVDRYASAAEKNQILAACDCYVSLHRSEGFGFGMAEAMLLERPVIATAYSGNLDFMTPANSFLVEHTLRPVGSGADPYPAEGEWAEPDLDHAAALMRQVVEHPDEAARRAARGAADLMRTNSMEAAGAAMAERLRHVHGRLRIERQADGAQRAHEQAARANALLDRGSVETGGRRLARARRLARKSVLRVIKPHTAHQRRIDRELAAGLDNLALQLAGMREDAERAAQRRNYSDALVLAQLRQHQRRLEALDGAGVPARLDDLATRLDSFSEQVRRHADALVGVGMTPLTGAEPAPGSYAPAPTEPWTHEYNDAHAGFVAAELDDPVLLHTFRDNAELPDAFGRGYDERVVEFPWIASRPLRGRLLDAGSTLNHLHVLARLRPRVDDLHIVTLAPEQRSFPGMGVSYLYADLRDLPLRDGTYDRITSISTLEHVGLDNTYYGSEAAVDEDPQRECVRAVRELRRVLAPEGQIYITVPVGRGERFDWVRSLTLDELEELRAALEPAQSQLTFFRHDGAAGWQQATAEEVADARYRDHFTSGEPGAERIVAAEAVACLSATA